MEKVGRGGDAGPVSEGHVRSFTAPIQALTNAGRNYNGPKVAKFLVGWSTITCPNDLKRSALRNLLCDELPGISWEL